MSDNEQYPMQVAVTVRGGGNSRHTVKTEAAFDKLIARLNEKWGSGAYSIMTRKDDGC